jgi:peptide/nickel transport system permease protein
VDLRTYVLRRLLLLVPVVLGTVILIFGIMQLVPPEGRASIFVRDVNQLRQIDRIIEQYHLNDPFYIQFYVWLTEVAKGNLGYSVSARLPVTQALANFFPNTAELAIYSVIPIILGGIWLGSIAAVRKDRAADHILRVTAITGYSLPIFWLGLLLLFFSSSVLQSTPEGIVSTQYVQVVGDPQQFPRYTYLITIDSLINGRFDIFVDALAHLVLPVITLSYASWAVIMRVMRSSMLETLGKDYVKTARAKGAEEPVVIKRHARRNALLPIATISGLTFAGLLNGVVITEFIFNRPGLGRWALDATLRFDYPGILGFTLFNAVLLVLANLIVDILYAYIDPRVRLG